jgi:hypothetical protein
VLLRLHLLLKHRIIQLSRQLRRLIHMQRQVQIHTQRIRMALTHMQRQAVLIHMQRQA